MSNKKSIEENFQNIEDIISNMQKEDITLEQSFDLYNKGLNLIKDCNSQIEKIEEQIKIINEYTGRLICRILIISLMKKHRKLKI